jgi:hypothetical protein
VLVRSLGLLRRGRLGECSISAAERSPPELWVRERARCSGAAAESVAGGGGGAPAAGAVGGDVASDGGAAALLLPPLRQLLSVAVALAAADSRLLGEPCDRQTRGGFPAFPGELGARDGVGVAKCDGAGVVAAVRCLLLLSLLLLSVVVALRLLGDAVGVLLVELVTVELE